MTENTYIHPWEGTGYYAGGFFGGLYENFVAACKQTAEAIETDLANYAPYIALWHDESHMNRYFIDHPPSVRLTPNCILSFCDAFVEINDSIYICIQNLQQTNACLLACHGFIIQLMIKSGLFHLY